MVPIEGDPSADFTAALRPLDGRTDGRTAGDPRRYLTAAPTPGDGLTGLRQPVLDACDGAPYVVGSS